MINSRNADCLRLFILMILTFTFDSLYELNEFMRFAFLFHKGNLLLLKLILQSSGLPPMPLFNGVGSSYPSGGFGNGGDSLPSMWSPSVETPNSEEIHESGVSGKKKV